MKQNIQKKDTFEDFIGIFENTLSPELCNTFVEWFEWCSNNNLTIGSTLTGKPPDTDDDGNHSEGRPAQEYPFPADPAHKQTCP